MKKGIIVIIIVLLIVGCGVLGYFVYNLNMESIKYQDEINDYKFEIYKLKEYEDRLIDLYGDARTKQKDEDVLNNDCAQIIKESTYEIPNSGHDGSDGGPVTENTSMTFFDNNVVRLVAGTAGFEKNYSVDDNIIIFNELGKAYGVISDNCKTIYAFNIQSQNELGIYHMVEK